MNPPYSITPLVLKLIKSISEKIGEVNANYLDKANPKLRKQNKIKTIHSSLSIEGNTLSLDQITALIENKRVIGPQKDIQEVKNAIEVYDKLIEFKPHAEKDFLKAHGMLMQNLVASPGKYRTSSVGIVKGNKVKHLAPPSDNVKFLMKDLFAYLKKDDELTLIKSCVFHYEMEFIHPFLDGNGRMGRLWQKLILMQEYSVFEFLPFETLISYNQKEYYDVLELCDKIGNSTKFIEFMLDLIDKSLEELLGFDISKLNVEQRLEYFLMSEINEFSRADYLNVFKNISSSTASRDLLNGINKNILRKVGDKNKTKYFKV